MTHDYRLKILKTALVIISIITIFRGRFGTPKDLRWSSMWHYITTQWEFTFSKSTKETLEHDVNYVKS